VDHPGLPSPYVPSWGRFAVTIVSVLSRFSSYSKFHPKRRYDDEVEYN
jgi:hypothetical protein